MKNDNEARYIRGKIAASLLLCILAGCSQDGYLANLSSKGPPDTVYAPGVDLRKNVSNEIEVAHRLMAAGQHELAIRSFNRAALDQGMNAEILSGLGTANLGLGRLGQSETLLRRAVKEDASRPEIWNNLGVVLMERGKNAEARYIFRKAYALSNGESDAIRDNLTVAIAKLENSAISDFNNSEYKLVRRGSSDYLIRRAD